MDTSTPDQITQLLAELGRDRGEAAWEDLLPLVYDELYRMSKRSLRGERRDHTLQPTALVNEAFMRLARGKPTPWNDRAHFYRVAARIMRHVLINHARERKAEKRGGGAAVFRVDALEVPAPDAAADATVDLLDLDEVLTALAAVDEQKARVVELRYFGGCTIDETAEALGISTASVERAWRFARAWLRDRLTV